MTAPPKRNMRTTAWPLALSLVGLAAIHTLASWGHTTLFWGDYGKWLHEVERVAGGDRLYVDVYWPQLPGAAWLFALWGRVAGTELNSIWTATTAVFLAGVAGFAALVWRIAPTPARIPLAAATAWLSWAVANIESAPLPMGMYTPAAALGGALLIGAVVACLTAIDGGGIRVFAGAGVLLGCVVLTKIDFWPPAGFLLLAVSAMELRSGRGEVRAKVPALWLASALVVAAGTAVLIAQSGLRTLPGVVTGFGLAGVSVPRSLPNGETIAIELGWTAAVLAMVAGAVWLGAGSRRAARWTLVLVALAASAAFLWFAGNALNPEAGDAAPPADVSAFLRSVLRSRAEFMRLGFSHAIPLLVPFAAIGAAWRGWRSIDSARTRRLLLLLLGVIVAARMRRLFHHVDWYHVLLELPAYALLLDAVLPYPERVRTRCLKLLSGFLAAYALGAYWQLGRGAMTREGWHAGVETARGTLHLPAGEKATYEEVSAQLDSLDPSGQRPLFAFAYQGGFNYFLGRSNPTMLTQGFHFGPRAFRERELARVEMASPPVILLDNPFIEPRMRAGERARWPWWRGQPAPNPYAIVDRPLFDRLAARCARVTPLPSAGVRRFLVYDCAAPRRPEQSASGGRFR